MPKLKRLEVQGYKTFATKIEFLFDEGITAIVGPNGSGKSNIADAIRWALGEQSFRTLRGRQTADMIFHGSEQRSRLGMASVTLTMDNSSGWLPAEFQEVAIARRAYRSGENEYLLNNTRVRLRDILEMLGATGLSQRTYTVIGQGLVDRALSLRPEERRTLFEEAAGIATYKDKRDEAVRKLEQTQANLLRVHDIVNEISPRLRRLETQAQRAREFAQVQLDLGTLLRTWHGYRWERALHGLQQAQERKDQVRQGLEKRQAETAEVEALITALQERQASLRRELVQWHRQSGELHRQAEAAQTKLAVRQERRRQLGQRIDDLERELAGLRVRREAQAERVADTETELTDIEARWQAQATEVAEAQSSFQAKQSAFQQQQEEVQRLQETVLGLVARLAEQEQQRQQIEAQRQRLMEERTSHEEAYSNALAEAKRWAAGLAAISKGIVAQAERIAKLEARQRQQEEALAEAERQQGEAAEQLAAAERVETRLRDRLDLLTRLQEEGEGYAAGVQALLQGRAKGIIGPVAQCLRVPAQLERALEASLGSRLQDLVIESRSDAEDAIAWLKREGAGRATFLPLDSLRPPPAITPPTGRGIIGMASDLVEADERVQPAVELLLGRTLIVEDLLTAHRVFSQQEAKPAPLQIVTLSGEMVRSDGRMSGGRGSGGSVLARERERRELPVRLQKATGDVKKAKTALAQAKAKTELGQNRLAKSAATIQALTKGMERQLPRQAEAQRPLDLARQREAWYRDLLTQAESELKRLRENTAILSADTEQLQELLSEDRATLAAAQEVLSELDASASQARLASLEAELSLCESQRNGVVAVLEGQREALAQVVEQIQGKEARSAELSRQQAELESEIAAHLAEAEALTAQLQEFTALIEPTEANLEQLAAEQAALESKERSLQERLRQEEVRASKLSLAVEHQQRELLTLHRDIDADLGPMKLKGVETLTFLQPLLPLRMPAEKLPTVQKLPQEVEADIRRLRRMGRQLGRVNPNAPAEYEEALERHHFLTGQAEDLEQASQSLREVIAELDQLMEQEFERTFLAIADQFKQYFTTLFGGGSARLELTAPDDLTHTGVEIIARPPGKRAQSLALLSGGERSLTAMALIFAILRVSPPPFCVLDEVDAMLDEANIGRFQTLLKELSTNTQFIIITHNRGTIEAADTIYGVSMGADSVSQVISLKLHGEQIAN